MKCDSGRRPILVRRGLVVVVEAPAGAGVSVALISADLLRRSGPEGTTKRPRTLALARSRFRAGRRPRRLRLRMGPRARRRLRAGRRSITVRVLVSARLPGGRRLSAVRLVRVSRRA